jgi:hypothetical protein
MPQKKTRITIRIDDDVLKWFRRQVRPTGGSYQTAIDLALRDFIAREPLEATLRRVVREELARSGVTTSPHAYADQALRTSLVADDVEPETEYGASLRRRPKRSRPRKG